MKDNKDIVLIYRGSVSPDYSVYSKHRIKLLFVLLLCLNFQTSFSETSEAAVTVYTPPSVRTTSPEQLNKLKENLARYNKKEFLLAYNVFIMNGSVELAYTVAAAAVEFKPLSIFWRKKLLQSSLWSNHPETALAQYLYFISNHVDAAASYKAALKLAVQLNDFDIQALLLKTEILKNINNKPLLLNYIKVMQNQGYPKKTLRFIQQIPNYEHDIDYLKELVTVTRGLDNPKLALHYAEQLWILDKHINSATQYAELLYLNGDIKSAYKVYNSASANAVGNKDFWQQYADISTLAGEDYSVINAYQELLYKNNIDKQALTELIRMEDKVGQGDAAYNDAKFAYEKYKYPELVPIIIDLGERLKKWREIHAFIKKIPQSQLTKLEEKPQFVLLLLNISDKLNLDWETHTRWLWVFQRWPNMALMQRSYLWYLMDNHDNDQLRYTLQRWRNILSRKKTLWQPHLSGLISQGQFKQALELLLRHQDKIKNSFDLIATLSDLYAQNNNFYASYYVGRRALNQLMTTINKHPQRLSLNEKLRLAELMQAAASETLTYQLILSLSRELFKSNEADNQIISWALKEQRYDLASYITSVHKLNNEFTPAWMTLTLALLYYDKDSMAELLNTHARELPYRDRVLAASAINNRGLAESYAFQGLSEHPDDKEMYNLFTQTMLPGARHLVAGVEEYSYGVVEGPVAHTSLRLFPINSVSIVPYETIWLPKSIDLEQIRNVPRVDNTTGVVVKKYLERGWASLNLGERADLRHYATARLGVQQQLSKSISALLSLGLHQPASETTPLLVGGMKNEAKLSLTYRWDSYNTFDISLKLMHYLGQDNSNLGSGEIAQAHWQQKLYLTSPDWNINIYSTWANFKKSNAPISYSLQQLVPLNTPATNTFFMPVNYKDVAFTVGLGQQFAKGYTHDWKAFGEAGIIYSIPFGLGEIIEAGMGGSVFGRDHLALYLQYSFNQQQAGQKNSTLGIRYDTYF